MKRFSTLLTAVAVFFTVQADAQTNYFENFEGDFSTTANGCWDAPGIFQSVKGSGKDYVIYDNASAYVEPPTSGASLRTFATPYLDLSTSVTVNFTYKLSSKLSGTATRNMEVGYVTPNGVFTPFEASFQLVNDVAPVVFGPRTYTIPSNTMARVAIRINGNADGNSRVAFDDISVNAPLHYSGGCNTPPTAVPNTYSRPNAVQISGNVINDGTGDDIDPENEGLVLTTVSAPDPVLEGTITWDASGNFTFTPVANYLGGTIQLTYSVSDNGFTSQSASTTLTINYAAGALSPLPVKLMSFAGSINSNRAQLRWSVADNETGDEFQVLRSSDAKTFTEAGTVFISNKVGAESYSFADGKELDAVTYYKLKIVNKDGSVSYSNVIALKSATTKATTGINILQNPVESTLTFTYSATNATQGQVAIYNTLGVKVYSSRIASQKGTNSVSLNLDSHLAAGTYILEVVNGSERAVTRMIKR